jgi:peptidoglycan/LPS O-acetylase OafA/YrhL
MALSRRRRIRPAPPVPERAVSPVPWIGMALIVSSFFLYAASGLVAPWWGVAVMVAVWLVLFGLCCAWWTPYPRRLLAIGALSFPLWFVLLVGGSVAFGWEP